MDVKETIQKSWKWIWHSDSILSWIIALILIFIVVKFLFFPGLSLVMGTQLPLSGVESSSMNHQIVEDELGKLGLCGQSYTEEQKKHLNFDEYWELCGGWYKKRNILKEDFEKFSFKNGFKKGDIIIAYGRFKPKVGDVIIFQPNPQSIAPRPIIHRIIKIEETDQGLIFQTKGDHNKEQLTVSNNIYRTDETQITQDQIIGKAVLKIPYLGWFKIWATEFFKIFS